METNYSQKPIKPYNEFQKDPEIEKVTKGIKETNLASKFDEKDENVQKISNTALTVFKLPKSQKENITKLKKTATEVLGKLSYEHDILSEKQDKSNDDIVKAQRYKEHIVKSQKGIEHFNKTLDNLDTISLNMGSPHYQDQTTGLTLERSEDNQLYALIHVFIGQGGQKTVKLAVDLNTFQPVARAAIDLTDPEKEKNVQNVVKIMNKLKGEPEFVNILATCSYTGKKLKPKMGVLMEYCNGDDLRTYSAIIQPNTLPLTQLLFWKFTKTLLSGIYKLEKNNIHHRDLKPENLLIYGKDVHNLDIKIADFDYATTVEDEINNPLSWVGSLLYLPPELFHNKPRTKGDIWAAGIILLEFRLSLIANFSQLLKTTEFYEDIATKLENLKQEDIKALFSQNVSETDPIETIEDLNYRMLQVDPDKRISAKEAWEAFQNLKQTENNFCDSEKIDYWQKLLYPEDDEET